MEGVRTILTVWGATIVYFDVSIVLQCSFMKKLAVFLMVLLVVLSSGCQKSAPVNLTEINAHVVDGGDPQADGSGIYISIDSTHENVVPINLPVEFQQKGINAPISIKIVNTGRTTRLNFARDNRVVYLVSIRKL